MKYYLFLYFSCLAFCSNNLSSNGGFETVNLNPQHPKETVSAIIRLQLPEDILEQFLQSLEVKQIIPNKKAFFGLLPVELVPYLKKYPDAIKYLMPTKKEGGKLDDLLLFAIDPNMDNQLFLRMIDNFSDGKKTLKTLPQFTLQLYKSLLGAQEFNKPFIDYLIKNEPLFLKTEELKKELIDTLIDWLVISTQTVISASAQQRREHMQRAEYYISLCSRSNAFHTKGATTFL